MRTLCIYHNDLDGHCSAAIIKSAFAGEIVFREMDYKLIPDIDFDYFNGYDRVVVVDFSLDERLMNYLHSHFGKYFIWIDHHKSSIELNSGLKNIPGRRDINNAACVLCWEYCYENDDVPRAVLLLADYDTFTFEFGDEAKHFQLGIKLHDTDPESGLWKVLLDIDSNADVDDIIKKGEVIALYRDSEYKKIVHEHSFNTTFHNYSAIACNSHERRSQLFDAIEDDYDLMLPFVWDGEKYTVSIFTKRDDIDCSELARRHGGGGHKKAAGFVCSELPFVGQ